MNSSILELARKPKLWQRSTEPFWDDVHVSEMMLASHLDPDVDGASRKIATIEQSVQWISTLIPKGAKILDLGCGPGLYTSRFSDKGYDVTGVDLSQRSINYASSQDKKTKYTCLNYLHMETQQKFDVITLIYCDYAALTQSERQELLKKVHNMLKQDGLFIFDVFTEAHYNEKKDTSDWHLYENGGFWSDKPHLCLEATYLYENNTVSADQYIIVTKEEVKEYIVWDTVYSVSRLTKELEAAGFHKKSIYGDVCGKEYSEQSETLCCIASIS